MARLVALCAVLTPTVLATTYFKEEFGEGTNKSVWRCGGRVVCVPLGLCLSLLRFDWVNGGFGSAMTRVLRRPSCSVYMFPYTHTARVNQIRDPKDTVLRTKARCNVARRVVFQYSISFSVCLATWLLCFE